MTPSHLYRALCRASRRSLPPPVASQMQKNIRLAFESTNLPPVPPSPLSHSSSSSPTPSSTPLSSEEVKRLLEEGYQHVALLEKLGSAKDETRELLFGNTRLSSSAPPNSPSPPSSASLSASHSPSPSFSPSPSPNNTSALPLSSPLPSSEV